MKNRPIVLSIAGFDPSGGAGLLADVKTFETIKVYGYGVQTALTWQNEQEFQRVQWHALEDIISQVEILFKTTHVGFVKIGLIENATIFGEILSFLHHKNPRVKIIWDPILQASAGFDFHSTSSASEWKINMSKLYLFTPNWLELQWLSQNLDGELGAEHLARYCHVYLKGGHRPHKQGYDYLVTKESTTKEGKPKAYFFRPKSQGVFAKHGSGCVLSSAILAYLAKGYPLHRACLLAKQYTTRFLSSNEHLLGYHVR